jgi:release factor glutamine methyltransferase
VSSEFSVAEAYRKGHTTFMGIELMVAPGALVPRPETELLGAAAIAALRAMNRAEPRVVDMCCGAGNLACAIAHHVPGARVWASDISDGCVEIARLNVARHGLADRVSVLQGDAFDAFAGLALDGTIDVIVCNPPYISDKRLDEERGDLLALEPREAFAAGPYGLSIHMRVAKHAGRYLRPGGILFFEVGHGQDRQVVTLLERGNAYDGIQALADEAGAHRVVSARAKAATA